MSVNIERFRQDLTYSTTASIAVVEADLRGIAKIDKSSEEKELHFEGRASKFGCLSCLSVVIAIPSLIAAGNMLSSGVFGILLVLLAAGGIVGFVATFIQNRKFKKQVEYHSRLNLSWGGRDRYELLQKIVKLWKRDMNSRRTLKMSLVLSKPDEKSKFVRQGTHPRHPNRQIDFYRDDWLKVKGRFADGTSFFLQIAENYQICTWRNENNKQKIKDKYKGSEISLRLKCPEILYQALPTLEADGREAVKLPETVILKRVEIAPTGIFIKVKVPPLDLDSGIGELRELYSQFMPVSGLPSLEEIQAASIGEKLKLLFQFGQRVKELQSQNIPIPKELESESMQMQQELESQRMQASIEAKYPKITQGPMGLLYQSIIMMHLSAYQILNLARILTQQQSA